MCIHTDLGWVKAREVRSQRQRRQPRQQQQPRQPQQQQQLGTSEFRPRIPSLHHAGTPIPFSKTTTHHHHHHHHHQSPNRSNRNTNHNNLLFLFSKADRERYKERKREREFLERERELLERGRKKSVLFSSPQKHERLCFRFPLPLPFACFAFSPAFRQMIIIKRMHTLFHAPEGFTRFIFLTRGGICDFYLWVLIIVVFFYFF